MEIREYSSLDELLWGEEIWDIEIVSTEWDNDDSPAFSTVVEEG